MGPESKFIKTVHRYVPDGVYWMKNHNQYLGGVPDVWYSGDKADLWIEYKFIVVPARGETIIDVRDLLSALQKKWLFDRLLEGRNVAVIVGCEAGGVWFDKLSWAVPITTKEFNHRLVDRKTLAKSIYDATTTIHNVKSCNSRVQNRVDDSAAVLPSRENQGRKATETEKT